MCTTAAAPAGGEHDTIGAEDADFSGFFFEDVGAHDAVLSHAAQFPGSNEVDSDVILEDEEAGGVAGRLDEGGGDLVAGGIPGVQDAAFGVPAFPSQREAFTIPVKVGAPGDELIDGFGTLFDNSTHVLFEAEARPGVEGVLHVSLDAVVLVAQAFRENG